jgi:hypothetical protein
MRRNAVHGSGAVDLAPFGKIALHTPSALSSSKQFFDLPAGN